MKDGEKDSNNEAIVAKSQQNYTEHILLTM